MYNKDMEFSIFTVVLVLNLLLGYKIPFQAEPTNIQVELIESQPISESQKILYTGTVRHIFFHSLIIYPKLAFSDSGFSAGYKDWMITRDEFQKILSELYKNDFILIDIKSLYSTDSDGLLIKKELYLPKGKKPLILSVDDLSYYPSLVGHGFADKLVLDIDGNVATEVVVENGKREITRDGDVVPILDDFVSFHPDFSLDGAKGIIATTGYHGILGYRTNNIKSIDYIKEVESAKKVVSRLESTGWRFANHSYSHSNAYLTGDITLEKVKMEAELWNKEVKPLVGETDIFIGPFGQIFTQNDPRREYLESVGFKVFCGVGMDKYLRYFPDALVMNRADIDGYRLLNSPHYLKEYFDVEKVIDPIRSL